MCGIIAYVGKQAAGPILLEGLQRLNYRGYDSSGMAVLDHDGALAVLKRAGKLSELEAILGTPPAGHTGIGHTRWATHGAVSDGNAHPHVSSDGAAIVVHNGIVENYRALRDRLAEAGIECRSETDSEVIPQLIALYVREGLGLRRGLPPGAGRGRGGQRRRRDGAQPARSPLRGAAGERGRHRAGRRRGRDVPGQRCPGAAPAHRPDAAAGRRALGADQCRRGHDPRPGRQSQVALAPHHVAMDPVAVAKGPYTHFMQKEIMEQPQGAVRLHPRAGAGQPGRRRAGGRAADRSADPLAAPRADHRHGHVDARGHGGSLLHGIAGRAADRLRQRLRVPLPRAAAGAGNAGRGGDAVGRDGGHAGRDGAGARPLGRAARGDHQRGGVGGGAAGGRVGDLPALRPGDRRRIDQDVHGVDGGAVPAGLPYRRGAGASGAARSWSAPSTRC